MPYKSRKNQKEYQRRYSLFRAKKLEAIKKAVLKGDLAEARRIASEKPNIHIRKR